MHAQRHAWQLQVRHPFATAITAMLVTWQHRKDTIYNQGGVYHFAHKSDLKVSNFHLFAYFESMQISIYYTIKVTNHE